MWKIIDSRWFFRTPIALCLALAAVGLLIQIHWIHGQVLNANQANVGLILPAIDYDAENYFARISDNGGTINDQQRDAITRLCKLAKAYNIWPHLVEVYPLAGNSLTGAIVKLKWQPYSGSSNLVATGYVATNYSEGVGVLGAATKYFSTGVNHTNVGTTGGLGFYLGNDSITNQGGLSVFIGSTVASPYAMLELTAGSLAAEWGNQLQTALSVFQLGRGYYHYYRPSATTVRLRVNGVLSHSATTGSSTTTRDSALTLMAGSGTFSTTNICAFASIDDGLMTEPQAQIWGYIVDECVRGMGRTTPRFSPQNYVFITGQSLASGSAPAISTVQSNLHRAGSRGPFGYSGMYAQGSYIALREISVETPASGFANAVTTFGYGTFGNSNDMTVGNFAVAGAGYTSLRSNTAPYRTALTNFTNAVRFQPSYFTGPVIVRAGLVVHGETDANSTTYSNDLRQWQADYQIDVQNITGQSENVPLFFTQIDSSTATIAIGGSRPTNTVNQLMLDAFEAHPTKLLLVGPKYQFEYLADGVHMTNRNYKWMAEYYAKAYYTHVVLGQQWRPLYPTNISRVGANIDLVFPTSVDLQFDTVNVTDPGNFGFEFFDDGGPSVTISSISWVGLSPTNTVRVTLSGTPTGGNKRIRYAYTGIAGNNAGPTTGMRGNLKRPETSLVTTNNLDDWCVHFNKVCP